MKFSTALTVSALASSALAIENVVKLGATKTRTVNLNTTEHDLKPKRLDKRSGTYKESLADDGIGYFATLSIGTPAQTVRVQIDTGSSDLWIPGTHNVQCPEGTATPFNGYSAQELEDFDYCLRSAEFDPDSSSTWKVDNTLGSFYIEYVDYSYARGTWGTDNVRWNDIEVDNFIFASATDANATAVFGIALEADESSRTEYPNWPVRLKTDGDIAKIVYSLYPNENPYTATGDDIDITILFGGVDTAKYSGTLTTFPLDSAYDLAITLTGVSTTAGGSTQSAGTGSWSAVLDSGTTLQVLPYALCENIAISLGGDGSTDSYGYYIVSSDAVNSDDYISYEFGSKTITVPVQAVIESDGLGNYILAIEPSDNYVILGDSFLINAYVLYDLEDHTISIAQANYSDEDDIVPVISTIPGATVANYAAHSSTAAPASTGFVTSLVDSSSSA